MPAEDGPVFIGGLDRSGKTPMRRMLEASSDIAFSRRMYLWTGVYGRYGDLADASRLAACLADLRRRRGITDLGIDVDAIEREMQAGPASYGRLIGLLGAQVAARAGRRRWGEQEGGIEERLEAILDAFPAARVIHMVRDPRDRHLALRRQPPGRLGVVVSRWRANVRRALSNAQRHPDSYLVVRYEDLASSPARTAERVCRFIGEPALAAVGAAAESWAAGGGRDYDARAIGRFASEAAPVDLEFIESRLAAEMASVGYGRGQQRLTNLQRLRYLAVTLPLNSLTGAAAGVADARHRQRGAGPRSVADAPEEVVA